MSNFRGVSVFQKMPNRLMILSDFAPLGIALLLIYFLPLLQFPNITSCYFDVAILEMIQTPLIGYPSNID